MVLRDYVKKDYVVLFQHDPQDGYFVRVRALEGCMSDGRTLEEACSNIIEAMELWLEVAIEDGDEIPEPDRRPISYDEYTAIILSRFVYGIAKIHRNGADDA